MTPAVGAELQRLLPQRLLCGFIYRVARARSSWIKTPLIAWFRKHYRVDLSEAVRSNASDYATFNEFFTRALKPGARVIAGDARSIVSPSDGTLMQFGTLDQDRMIQAKGKSYTVTGLLGESSLAPSTFVNGHYATIYLAPRNYHRVHAPIDGALIRTRYIPGERFSVNAATASAIAELFCRNERVVCWLDCAFGPAAVVLVGALNVSSISTTAHGEIRSGSAHEWRESPPVPVAKGAEIGRFNLGSTVIVLFPRGTVRWEDHLKNGDSLLMGAEIARLTKAASGPS
jgi:phosphatidylserine decarboxylase